MTTFDPFDAEQVQAAWPLLSQLRRETNAALDTAIDESLRLRPPVMFVVRGCVADTQIGGCPRRLSVQTHFPS